VGDNGWNIIGTYNKLKFTEESDADWKFVKQWKKYNKTQAQGLDHLITRWLIIQWYLYSLFTIQMFWNVIFYTRNHLLFQICY